MTPHTHDSALKDPELLQNVIRGLSPFKPQASKPTDSHAFLRATKEVKKHVTLLDGIALLLTAEAKSGEVTATGMFDEANKLTIV